MTDSSTHLLGSAVLRNRVSQLSLCQWGGEFRVLPTPVELQAELTCTQTQRAHCPCATQPKRAMTALPHLPTPCRAPPSQLYKLLNTWWVMHKLPPHWWKAPMVVFLNPEKDVSVLKSFSPILLLCRLYKLYECLFSNCLSACIENHLIEHVVLAKFLTSLCPTDNGFEKVLITGRYLLTW